MSTEHSTKSLPSSLTPREPPKPHLAVCMAEVTPEQVEWLWEPYIPRGKLTLIEGDPGVGKSWLTLEIATRLSRGEKLPGMMRPLPAASSLILTQEDGKEDTIRPRLDLLGADVSRIHVIDWPITFDDSHARMIAEEIKRLGVSLVVIDPIIAYLTEGTDMNNASRVRPTLARLAQVGHGTGAAFVLLRHLTKGTQDKAIYRGQGTMDFMAASRSALFVGVDPNDEQRRIVAHSKHNLSDKGPSWAYRLTPSGLRWAGSSQLGANDLAGPEPNAEARSALEEAQAFLVAYLQSGPKPATDVFSKAQDNHIAEATLKRAKASLGVTARRTQDHWIWELPRKQVLAA